MSLNLKPLGARVIVEPIEKEEETFAGGALVLPETASETQPPTQKRGPHRCTTNSETETS
jgi:co-chaperonin GroES (HSP10)